jgi:tRNA A37 threonylcarbamoyltransferase TsaD
MGTTIDDSLGEAFDKVARLLGISAVPGGFVIGLGFWKPRVSGENSSVLLSRGNVEASGLSP